MAEHPIPLSRRDALRYGLGIGGSVLASYVLSACGSPQPHPQAQQASNTFPGPDALVPTPSPLPAVDAVPSAPPIDLSNMQQLIDTWAVKVTKEDKAMLKSTQPGVDLRYSDNETVKAIRAVPDKVERIMAAISFLDVQNSARYNYDTQKKYSCNTYALDLLTLLLGNDVIGSRYNVITGAPQVFGAKDIAKLSKASYEKFTANNPFLHSNNLDVWMKKYGDKLGWRKVASQVELQQCLEKGAVGLGVSSQEHINSQRKIIKDMAIAKGEDPNKVDFIGHAFVVANGRGNFVISQSTDNIQLQGFSYDSLNQKVCPEKSDYSFWVHDLP